MLAKLVLSLCPPHHSAAVPAAAADQIELVVEDMTVFIERLNEGGDLLKKGNARYQLCGCRGLLPAASGGGGGLGSWPASQSLSGRSMGGGGWQPPGSQLTGSKRSFARSYGGL